MSELDNDGDDVTLQSVLERYLDARDEEQHTALPGRVESYDAASQTASVTPLIRRRIPTTDGRHVSEAMPTIRAVPVCWPRAGDWFLHMPLTAGDTVLLVCCERDLAGWRVTGQVADPIDHRGHHLAHAVAIPGVYPRTRQLADTPGDTLVIGRDGGATIRIEGGGDIMIGTAAAELVALGNLVDIELAKIQATLGSGTVGGDAVAFTVPYEPGAVSASKTRAE